MVYVFLALSFVLSGLTGWLSGWFSSWNALWQLPLTFAGIFLGFVILFLLLLFVSTRFVDPKKLLEKPSRYFRFMLNQFCRLAFFLGGVHVHVTGLEKLPHDHRFLLVSNHLFAFDPLIYYYAIPHDELAFISKKENFSLFMVAEIMRELLCLPIDRENARNALTTINAAANLIRAHVCSFAIYPEGTRSKSSKLLPWHAGSLKIAQKAGVPIVVGTVEGTERIARNVPWRRSHVYVRIREVIPAEAVKAATTSALTEDICGKMRAALGK